MRPKTRDWLIICGEVGLFALVLFVLWLDEFIDLPYLLFGAPSKPFRLEEFLIETVLILIVAPIVIAVTFFIQYRSRRIEQFLRVCAWCRKVWMDDKWVRFEDYIQKSQALRSSHGICEECLSKQKLQAKQKREDKQQPC
jgi:hypothetical protein